MFCRNCGESLPDDSLFCNKCGVTTSEEVVVSTPPEPHVNVVPVIHQTFYVQQQPVYPPREYIPFNNAKIALGIVSICIFIIVVFQSCVANLAIALAESNDISGALGQILAFFMLVSGIVAIAARRHRAGSFVCGSLFIIAALFGFVNITSDYGFVVFWGFVSLIFGITFMAFGGLHNEVFAKHYR